MYSPDFLKKMCCYSEHCVGFLLFFNVKNIICRMWAFTFIFTVSNFWARDHTLIYDMHFFTTEIKFLKKRPRKILFNELISASVYVIRRSKSVVTTFFEITEIIIYDSTQYIYIYIYICLFRCFFLSYYLCMSKCMHVCTNLLFLG